MADTISNLTFNNDQLTALGLPLASFSGNLNVDYTTNNVTGTLSTQVLSTLQVQNYTNYSLSFDSGTNLYTIVGTSPGVTGSISLTYAGQSPSSVDSSATIAGLPLLAGTAGAVTSAPICFAAGTLILTETGEVAVENLKIGDKVVTASGTIRQVVWLGRRTIDCTRHETPRTVWPVRILRDAFGDGKPSRDLHLSPQHSVAVTCVEDVLIPIRYLVNGATIAQEPCDRVEYWHVELDTHDLVLAENLATESFLDTQGRAFFENGANTEAAALKTFDDFCRPIVLEGPIITAVRSQLRRRMTAMDWALDFDADLHVTADGVRIDPAVAGSVARFLVPSITRDLRIKSRTFIPAEVDIDSGDGRALGVPLQRISVIDGLNPIKTLPLSEQDYAGGFWHVQEGAGVAWRWTTGDAVLDPTLWDGCEDMFFLRLELASDRGQFRTWVSKARPSDVVDFGFYKSKAA